MFVENILKQKGSAVLTTTPGQPALDIAREMADKNIGILIVIGPKNDIVGIISERDLVRGAAQSNGDLSGLKVSDLMTPDVITCVPGDSLQKITSIMTSKRVRHVPVVNGGELLGLISIGDVLKYRLEETLLDEEAMRDYISGRLY